MSSSGAANSPKRIGLLAFVGSHDMTLRPGCVEPWRIVEEAMVSLTGSR